MSEILNQLEQYVNLRVARGRASPHTVRSYVTQARMYLDWCAARALDPRAATEDNVLAYRSELIERYAVATVALKLNALRVLYRSLGSDVADSVAAPRDLSAPEERIDYLTPAQVAAVLASAEGIEDQVRRARDVTMLKLLAAFGIRAAELRGLDVGDVMLEEPGRLVIRSGKGRKRRTLYLTPDTAGALREWLAVRPASESDALFTGSTGRGRLSDSGLRKIVNAHLRAAGVTRGSVHIFRHTALTLAVAGGAALQHVQRMAGHADPRTTDLYVHLVDAQRLNPALRVEVMLAGGMV